MVQAVLGDFQAITKQNFYVEGVFMQVSKTEFTEIMKPDTYLLYETRANAPSNTNIRFALEITEDVNGEVLSVAVNEAIKRYPYFSVRIEIENENYVLVPNNLPIVVMKTKIPSGTRCQARETAVTDSI